MAAALLDTNVARVKPTTRSIQAITNDDTKVLGRQIERKREKTIPPTQFKTRLFKTHHSNWTPVVHRPSNEQVRPCKGSSHVKGEGLSHINK